MSDIPTGADEMPQVTRPKPMTRKGNDTGNIADNPEPVGPAMGDAVRKGATGPPVNQSAVPLEGGDQSAERYGLARGPQGANS